MSTLAVQTDERVQNVQTSEDYLTVALMHGRIISVPLIGYPRLLNASVQQLADWSVCGGGYGIHWEELDEDLSTEGLLRGASAPRSESKRNHESF